MKRTTIPINKKLATVEPSFVEGTILTNDPSATAWGWAIMSWDGIVIKTGTIKTATEGKKRRIRKGDENVRRISEINHQILDLIKACNVKFIVSELQHGSQNANAALWQGAVTALIIAIADALDLPIEFYSEGDSKKALLNKPSASKQETIDAITKLYVVPWTGKKWRDEAVADAISVFHVARIQSSVIKMFKK